MKKSKEDKANVGKSKLHEFKHFFEASEAQIPTHLARPSKVRILVNRIRDGILRFVLDRCSVDVLDKAMTDKLGKPPTKSQIVRERAKSFNEGYQQALKDYEDRWLA